MKHSSLSESLPAYFDHVSDLRTFGNFHFNFPLWMIDLDFSSQDKIKYASIDFDVEIIAFPFVEFGGGDIDSYVEISVLASDSFVTFASKFDI